MTGHGFIDYTAILVKYQARQAFIDQNELFFLTVQVGYANINRYRARFIRKRGIVSFSESENTTKRSTLQDIARAVGVSKGTVDRALHNRQGIKPEVKRKIIDKVQQLNYKPNRIARVLSKKQIRKIGLIYPKEPAFFWDKVRQGFDAAAKELEEYGIEIIHCHFEFLDEKSESILIGNIDHVLERGASSLQSRADFPQYRLAAALSERIYRRPLPLAGGVEYDHFLGRIEHGSK